MSKDYLDKWEERQKSEIIIDLTGPDGNAFALMGYEEVFSKKSFTI